MLEDSPGAWRRLLLRLSLAGLTVIGIINPQQLSVQPHLLELTATLRSHGIDDPPIPLYPVTHSHLIQELSVLGLLSTQ